MPSLDGQTDSGVTPQPRALAAALELTKSGVRRRTPSESPSEEDYDEQQHGKLVDAMPRRRVTQGSATILGIHTPDVLTLESTTPELGDGSSGEEVANLRKPKDGAKGMKTYIVASDDIELREILRRGLDRVRTGFKPRKTVINLICRREAKFNQCGERN